MYVTIKEMNFLCVPWDNDEDEVEEESEEDMIVIIMLIIANKTTVTKLIFNWFFFPTITRIESPPTSLQT